MDFLITNLSTYDLTYTIKRIEGGSNVTLSELKELNRDIITPAQAADVLQCDPHYIRLTARECPERLGFPVIVMNSRTKIPRIPFIRYIEGQ